MSLPIYFPAIMIPARYFIIAGIFYFIFYVIGKNKLGHLKIQQKFPDKKMIHAEMIYSLCTMLIFTGVAYSMFHLDIKMYRNIDNHGLPYFLLSIIFLIIFHDFYFYLTHRIMHHKKLFFIHRRHHLSINPTPWAAFSFSPIEAIIQIIWIPIIALFIPLHFFAIMTWALWMMIMNVIGHLGYEIYPRNFLNTFIVNNLLSSTHHNLHHSRSKSNYGLYFTFWDKILGTEDEKYKSTFEKIKHNSSRRNI